MKEYILLGTGNRMVEMFLRPLITDYQEIAKIVAIYDVNLMRAQYVASLIPYFVPTYDDVNVLFKENKADYSIIATIDSKHEEYIQKSLASNMKVICEKPVCITSNQCKSLMNLLPSQQQDIIVTFNSRYMPINIKIREIMKSGILGNIYSVSYHYYVDVKHGAEYFRRWHRYKEKSGSLLIHKSVHHFDLINWWLNDKAVSVNANGELIKFGKDRRQHSTTCRMCKENCQFKVSPEKKLEFKEMYYNAETVDGYIRDKCIYDNDIDIYDTMSANIVYQKGTCVDYALILYSAYTGFSLRVYGENGQLDIDFNQSNKYNNITLYDIECKIVKTIVVESLIGKKHNGGDEKLRKMLFSEEEWGKLPRLDKGVDAVKLGVAACESIEKQTTVNLSEIFEANI